MNSGFRLKFRGILGKHMETERGRHNRKFFIAFGILFIYIFDKNLWHYYNTVNQIYG